jgi:hypothetical protein
VEGRKPELLCVGRDAVLNRTRRLVLERCFAVELAHSLPEAQAKLTGRRFDLVLLCYSLTDDECRRAVEFIHRLAAAPRILALAESRRRLSLEGPDEEYFPDGPADLLAKAAAMAGIPAAERKRCAGGV